MPRFSAAVPLYLRKSSAFLFKVPKRFAAMPLVILFMGAGLLSACSSQIETGANNSSPQSFQPTPAVRPTPSPSQAHPNLQSEILDDRFKTSNSPLAKIDFKNYSYPLPRGWQNPDGSDLTLINGKLDPVSADTDLGMDPEEAANAKSQRRIGGTYVTTRFFDATGDGQDEALVILKIETTGSAVPQIVYIYTYKDNKPELIWYFRTGDRADGGLKDLRPENGQLVVELFGQDRFLLGETETAKITDDYEQICCPTFFTRSVYKWNGRNFLMQGKRLTFSVADPTAKPVENMAEVVEKQLKSGKK
jgi:hypothetical protein